MGSVEKTFNLRFICFNDPHGNYYTTSQILHSCVKLAWSWHESFLGTFWCFWNHSWNHHVACTSINVPRFVLRLSEMLKSRWAEKSTCTQMEVDKHLLYVAGNEDAFVRRKCPMSKPGSFHVAAISAHMWLPLCVGGFFFFRSRILKGTDWKLFMFQNCDSSLFRRRLITYSSCGDVSKNSSEEWSWLCVPGMP